MRLTAFNLLHKHEKPLANFEKTSSPNIESAPDPTTTRSGSTPSVVSDF